MEYQIALIDKTTNRIKSVIVVADHKPETITAWENEDTLVVPVLDSPAYVYGLWNGETFEPPTKDYLIEIGLVQPEPEPVEADA